MVEPVNDLVLYVIQCQPKERCKPGVPHSVATADSTKVWFIAHLVLSNARVNEEFQTVELLCTCPYDIKTGAGEIVFSTGKTFK